MKGIELAEDQTSITQNSAVFAKITDKTTEALLQGFGRAEELDADKVGVRFEAQRGYSPVGLVGFLETLKAQNEGASSRAGLFASHPETQERIDRLTAQIKSEGLSEQATAVLAERLHRYIKYQLQKPTANETAVAGAKGLAGGQGSGNQAEPEKKKKSRFSLSRLTNPSGSGEKKESGEVTGAGSSRGVGTEDNKGDESGKPKNVKPLEVRVSAADLEKFRQEGKLR
jgi:hypothetical protein